jgi:ATP-dependent Lhr-like helicase
MLQTQPRSGFAFDPLIERWFDVKFGEPTAPQVSGWPLIAQGRDVLICAPTGSGKTLAAFLMALDRLVRLARSNELTDATHVVYVSPLKALVNDVHRNLEVPLGEINELAARDGISLSPIRVTLRTGDSTHSERARMLFKRPHILVTTPESLFILLTAKRSRELFRSVSTVIVDEIHAMVASKRGPHLALSLARLDRLVDASGRSRPRDQARGRIRGDHRSAGAWQRVLHAVARCAVSVGGSIEGDDALRALGPGRFEPRAQRGPRLSQARM